MKIILFISIILVIIFSLFFRKKINSLIFGKKTVEEVIETYSKKVDDKFKPIIGEEYPPKELYLVADKKKKILTIYYKYSSNWKKIIEYPILAASGELGPKLKEGDKQVPEGIYEIELLNPNSSFHLSMKINYPNEFDRAKALLEGRTRLGGDIFIHGKNVSIGCLAIGDEAIEELFTLVARSVQKTKVLILPNEELIQEEKTKYPNWITELYENIKKEQLSQNFPK
ncbi:MAG: L,D-transpeptidase family protein [Leptospiraceae bacterium]|nr:L,D-transpeptidase family protein [Leptospiraceae bacterium]